MSLAKLTIEPLSPSGLDAFEVLFNPNSYSIEKSVTWRPPRSRGGGRRNTQREVNAPALEFGGGGSRSLTMDLFFDVTILDDVDDVRQETDQVVALTRIDRAHPEKRPPTCKVIWGEGTTADFPFVGVLSQLTQTFTLFDEQGTPIRAELSVRFTEFLDQESDKRKSDPEYTTRVVRRGDTLAAIAADVYGDASLWPEIAAANELDDPLRLEIGRVLSLPDPTRMEG